jgi:subfamily B ATP-binding cassette protein MsbA
VTDQLARAREEAGDVVRQVRGLAGVPWRRLLAYLRPHRVPFGIALLSLLLGSALGLLVPLVIAGIATQVVTGGDSAGLNQLVLFLLGLAAVSAILGMVQTTLLGIVGERIVADLRGQLFGRLVTLSLDFHAGTRVGEMISRLSSDVTQVRTMLTQTITGLLTSFVGLVGSVVILFLLSPALLVVALLVVPALLVTAILFGRPLQRARTAVQDEIAAGTTTAEEALAGIRVVKSFVREDWEQERYGRSLRRIVDAATRLAIWRGGFGGLMTFLGFGTLALLLWYTGNQVIEGRLAVGTLTSFLLYGVSIAANLGGIASGYGQFREGTGAVQRVFEILDMRPTIVDPVSALPMPRVRGAISFESDSFAYAPDRPILRDISLEVGEGEVLALVGPSGAGKTTLVNLVPRLWDVRTGAIRIDGSDVRSVAVRSLREQIGLVPQDAALFGGSIRDNIRYGRLDATDAEVEEAARVANAHDFVSAFPRGYDTLVGDRGVLLSGGERQRVSIARAVLKDPRILLLDEATSALDSESERLVQDALDRLEVGRTTIVIAHRLSTVRAASRIAVLDAGELVEIGTHDELLARDGLYARLYRLQFVS